MTDFTEFSGTRPVATGHAFDHSALGTFMRDHVDGFSGDLTLEQFKGGQSNPTFRVSAGGRRYVLRRKPPGVLLPSAHAVDREYRVMSALAKADVPVARTYALCEDVNVIGTAFYIMDCVEGRILWDPTLPGMSRVDRAAHYDEMNRVMAELHRVNPAAIGLADFGKPGNYIERQVGRWTKQYRAAETETIDAADELIDWLPKHTPIGEESRIVHGDFRIDNVVFHPHQARILAVLDWELSTLGHPLVDFAYHCLVWHMKNGDGSRGLAGLDLTALGIPSEAAYLQRYLQRAGRTVSSNVSSVSGVSEADWNYYVVFNMFRLVGILQGITARALQGNASSERAVQAGRRARPLAELAWALAQTIKR
jgi:aminoglycoside phosphotransferase (APT) family kinase protein